MKKTHYHNIEWIAIRKFLSLLHRQVCSEDIIDTKRCLENLIFAKHQLLCIFTPKTVKYLGVQKVIVILIEYISDVENACGKTHYFSRCSHTKYP